MRTGVSKKKKENDRRKNTDETPTGEKREEYPQKKYDTLKKAILSALRKNDLTHTELFSRVNERLDGKFSGNIRWYGETVKLDLEARKIIERTASKPQKYRLR